MKRPVQGEGGGRDEVETGWGKGSGVYSRDACSTVVLQQ